LTILQCFSGKDFKLQKLLKKKARIFTDYGVPGQIHM